MKLTVFPIPRGMTDVWAYLLGWAIHRTLCLVGWHEWMYDANVKVPFYGSGHEQCLICGLIKVKPTP